MAVKHIIAKGVGFADAGDNLKYIPTHGFTIAAVVVPVRPFSVFVTDALVSGLSSMDALVSGESISDAQRDGLSIKDEQ